MARISSPSRTSANIIERPRNAASAGPSCRGTRSTAPAGKLSGKWSGGEFRSKSKPALSSVRAPSLLGEFAERRIRADFVRLIARQLQHCAPLHPDIAGKLPALISLISSTRREMRSSSAGRSFALPARPNSPNAISRYNRGSGVSAATVTRRYCQAASPGIVSLKERHGDDHAANRPARNVAGR